MQSTQTKPTEFAVRREPQELELLYEISQALDRSLDLREATEPLLAHLAERMNFINLAMTIFNRETREVSVEASFGLSEQQRSKARYQSGEGLTGAVAESGEAVLVPSISEDPRFLDRTGARKHREDLAFLCIPIVSGSEVVGTLSAMRPATPNADQLHEDQRLLTIIASMVAQAVKLRRTAEEERLRLLQENERLQSELQDRFRPDNIIGNSQAMQAVYDLIAQVAKSDTTVTIFGESGTGKELVAHAIHYNSNRAKKPYVKVNCAALPESVMESELFGHEKGAFTGAVSRKKGRFEIARGGTIFLDEIGELSPSTQVKLLRFLQEKEFERVGGTETIKANVRIITATNRALESMVETGQFREDLFYRLNVFPIHLPLLRDRKSDILLLAEAFIEKYAKAAGKDVRRISTPAIDMLTAYHWPGNVRELENGIERAVLLTNDHVIHGHHLPPSLQTAELSGTRMSGTLQEKLDSLERELIIEALKDTRGNCAKSARILGVTERIMGLRLEKYEIDYRRFRRRLS